MEYYTTSDSNRSIYITYRFIWYTNWWQYNECIIILSKVYMIIPMFICLYVFISMRVIIYHLFLYYMIIIFDLYMKYKFIFCTTRSYIIYTFDCLISGTGMLMKYEHFIKILETCFCCWYIDLRWVCIFLKTKLYRKYICLGVKLYPICIAFLRST